jgi:hypothetical protein
MTEKKIEQFWRDATSDDVAKVMRGEKVEARFRDSALRDWKFGHLNGWADGEFRCDLANCWVHCQVYDPPEWYTNKPDPGEGYRLLEKFPDELKLATDEAWNWDDEKWQSIARDGQQEYAAWYRRRIEPEKVDSRSKDYIPSGWVKLPDDEPRLASDAYWSQGASEWCLIGEDRVSFANRSKWPAIRQRKFVLAQGESHKLPNGLTLEVYKKGFEVP